MTEWFILEPRDRLVVRDGRPIAKGDMRTLPFPYPSSLAGMVRTQLGTSNGAFDSNLIDSLLKDVSVHGPLLVQLNADGELESILLRAPGDLVWFKEEQADRTVNKGYRLAPKEAKSFFHKQENKGAFPITDLDERFQIPSFCVKEPEGKPGGGSFYWPHTHYLEWLAEPTNTKSALDSSIATLDIDVRTHVGISSETLTAKEGVLFSTEGLSFHRKENKKLLRLGLLAGWSGSKNFDRKKRAPFTVPFGGERSLSFFSNAPQALGHWLAIPDQVKNLKTGDIARVLLLTPAIFDEGAIPQSIHGAKVISAKVDRPQVISGWDYKEKKPKPTRRMAPTGSVYWVTVPNDQWAEETWLSHISSQEQDQRDGFGLALVGV